MTVFIVSFFFFFFVLDFGCAVIPGIIEPINQIEKLQNMHLLCGKYKGIQGHNNSCYLDATLFSMFTFTRLVYVSVLAKNFIILLFTYSI